ncbi:hypothetical protein AB4542_15380, partial [Vibrio breoganii]
FILKLIFSLTTSQNKIKNSLKNKQQQKQKIIIIHFETITYIHTTTYGILFTYIETKLKYNQ